MKICAHKWSAKPHVGRESRICGRCNEWEVDVELSQARAAIVSLGKQRDDAYLDLREAREAYKAERDELEKHLSEAEDERDAAKTKVDRLRNALACISLDEYESTSSASDKVHGHARIARKALSETKDDWEYCCRGCQAKLADVVVDGKAFPRVTLCDRCTERRGERLLRDRDLVDLKLAEANESLKTLTACNESLRGLFQKLRDAVNMPVEAEAEVTDRILRELERLKPTALDRRDYDSALKEMFRRDHQKAVYNQAWEKAILDGASREEAHDAARKAVQENPWSSKDKQ